MEAAPNDDFLARAARVPDDVLVQHLPEGESVILNMVSERYYGLDEVGARMWAAATESPTLSEAFEMLLAEYDVDAARLREDLRAFVERLAERGLLDVE